MFDIALNHFKHKKKIETPPLRSATVINLLTLKGGVGKTTIALELSKFIAKKSLKVLAIDLDPQANLSLALSQMSFDAVESQKSLYETLVSNESVEQSILKTNFCVDLMPSSSLNSLINQTRNMDLISKSISLFKKLRKKYDYIIIDSNPTTCVSHAIGIINSDFVLSPIYLDAYSLQGLSKTFADVKDVCKKFNHKVQHKVIFNRIFHSELLSVEKAEKVRNILPADSWLASFSMWNFEQNDPLIGKEIGLMIQSLLPEKNIFREVAVHE